MPSTTRDMIYCGGLWDVLVVYAQLGYGWVCLVWASRQRCWRRCGGSVAWICGKFCDKVFGLDVPGQELSRCLPVCRGTQPWLGHHLVCHSF